MIQKIKHYLFISLSTLTMLVPAMVPIAVHACDSNIADQVASGASTASGSDISCDDTNVGGTSLANLANKVVNVFSIVVGAVAVIMIIYGGFRYITSGGDSGSVGNAKNTLIYAIVGLVIVALAQLIVHFVLNQTDNVSSGA